MAGKTVGIINLSAWQFAQLTGITINKIVGALKANGVEVVRDRRYTLKELVAAIRSPSGLKQEAEDARYQKQIDEAQVARDKVLENKGELIRKKDIVEFLSDAQTVLFQIIRHSKLSEQEKALLNRQITDLKWEKSQ